MQLRKPIFVIFLVLSLALSAQASFQLLAPQDESVIPVAETTTTLTSQPATSSLTIETSSDPAVATSTDPGVATIAEPVVSPIITPKVQPAPTPDSTSTISSTSAITAPVEPSISTTLEPAKDSETRKSNFAKVSSDLENISSLQASADLSSLLSKTESDLNQTKVDLADTRANLVAKNLSPKILARFDDYQTNYENQVSNIIAKLKSGSGSEGDIKNFLKKPEVKIENQTPFRAIELRGEINKVPASEFPSTASKSSGDLLKQLISSATLKKIENLFNPNPATSTAPESTSSIQPLTSNALPPTPADTAETEEVKFTQNIKNLATSLNFDPLTIFNYVSNNVDYVPYYGSKKGADATLIEKAGNDFDQSSLLIALLRAGDGSGQNKTPSHYVQASVKLDLGTVMDLLGVEDPIVAATVLEKADIPYALYVDQNQNPLFFVAELTYVEAYVDYDYTRGAIQGNPGASKRWVPLAPSLSRNYKSQHLNAPDAMGLNIQTFYDNYLNGNYGTQKSIDALKTEIQNYLTASQPDLTPEDTLTQTYRSEKNLEFLPLTPPFEIVSAMGTWSAVPDNLKQKLNFIVQNDDASQIFLNTTVNVSSLADKELLLDYIAASPDDQAVIDSFPTIYDVVPLSLVNLKPTLKINGAIQSGGGSSDPEIQMGQSQKLKIIFKNPDKSFGLPVAEKIIETVEKSVTAGNSEGIAINTDRVAPPETRPSQDTQTTSPVASQKLYKTAQNFLYRLESSHNDLARIFGGRFINSATRAVVFNGIDVNYQSGQPYSFSWKGLRIDSSSAINYYSHFSPNPNLHQKEFMYVFGLQASLDEADIFESDYAVASVSTVKGLKLINQNQIPGVTVKKITLANESDLDALTISPSTKTKLRDSIHQGHLIYVPSQQFTYQSWTGLVYIDIDPNTGFGGYIIGEGLNGGYTATPVEQWPSGLVNFLIHRGLNNLAAVIISPTPGQEFAQSQKIPWQANYSGTVIVVGTPFNWTENLELNSSAWPVGNVTIPSGYGTNVGVTVLLKYPMRLGTTNNQFDKEILDFSTPEIPGPLIKSVIHKESSFRPDAIRYEIHTDYNWYSRLGPEVAPTLGWRGVWNYPEKHWRLSGHNVLGDIFSEGDQVKDMHIDIYTRMRTSASPKLETRDINSDGTITTQEVKDLNEQRRWTSLPPSLDYTAQLILASSYGLMQPLYDTARWNGFEDTTSPARHAEELFIPKVNVQVGVHALSFYYGIVENQNPTWTYEQKIKEALLQYNGNPQYPIDVYKIYSSGTYDQQ